MTNKIQGTKPYVDAISRLYHGEGAIRLKGLARIFEREMASFDPKDSSKELSKRIVVLQIAIDAKKAYYSGSKTGYISNIFHNGCKKLFKWLNYETALDKAERVLAEHEKRLGRSPLSISMRAEASVDPDRDLPPEIEAMARSKQTGGLPAHRPNQAGDPIEIARCWATTTGQTLHVVLDKDDNEKTLVARPNGDVIVYHHTYKFIEGSPNLLGYGATRTVFKGKLYQKGEEEAKDIAIATTIPINELREAEFSSQDEISRANNSMQREHHKLLKFHDQDGIIRTHGIDTLNINGKDFCFQYLDLCPLGDLGVFINRREGHSLQGMNDEQKIHFIRSLIDIFNEIHARGEIHRDVSYKNILVVYDESTKLYKPVLIDFETYISSKNRERKKEVVGTQMFWAPENVRTYLRDKDVSEVTTTAMDNWALGVVLYRIWFNEDLLDRLGYHHRPDSNLNFGNLKKLLTKEQIDGAFSDKDLDHPIARLIVSMLDPRLSKRAIRSYVC